MGSTHPDSDVEQQAFFYNEQIYSLPWNYTSFAMPDQMDPEGIDPDNYHVRTSFTNPRAYWRRWTMPDDDMPEEVPPIPPDLTQDITPQGGSPFGQPRRAAFEFDPDLTDGLYYDTDGVRMYGGVPEGHDTECSNRRPGLYGGAGDLDANDLQDPSLPVEIAPYTDPFAPFNPQHPHAPRGDSITFNPAFMDEFRHFGEDLRTLYQQISSAGANAREKVYHRTWYEPDHLSKIRFTDDCSRDLSFPAVMQEFTYLYVNMMDHPGYGPPGSSRFGFPIGTRASELPAPLEGSLPAGGSFGYGLTTFDSNFDGRPEAVTIHSEQTLADYMNSQWQANRPTIPGIPPVAIDGPVLDFDGDGVIDDLDEDNDPLTGDEMVVFAVDSIVLDNDPDTAAGQSAMLLDHMVSLVQVSSGDRAQLQIWSTGGGASASRPETVGGPRSLNVGDAAIVDRFQDSVTQVGPGEQNTGTDGAWFVFVESVDSEADRVTITLGRALGASHSAIDNGSGLHDLAAGDPWYLKRFYVDGHEYNVAAVMTMRAPNSDVDSFQFITIRTPVPKGNFFNSQDTILLQGYFLDGLPPEMSVMPPHNVEHTVAHDVTRIDVSEFADPSGLGRCHGELMPADALVETITEELPEGRYWTELREIWDEEEGELRWQTDQHQTSPYQYTELGLPADEQYLLTSNWTSRVSRLAFYGCTPVAEGPFPEGQVGLTQDEISDIADDWAPPQNIIPESNRDRVVDVDGDPVSVPYYDARIGPDPVRMKFFYDPNDADDPYVGTIPITVTLPGEPNITIQKRLIAPDPTTIGATVSFAITVTNSGDIPLTHVVITDTFDTAYLDYLGSTIAPDVVDEPAGFLLWNAFETNGPGGTLAPGEVISMVVDFLTMAEPPNPQRASNTVRVITEEGSTDSSTDDVGIRTPTIRTVKTLMSSDPTTTGSTVIFQIRVINTGTAVLTNVDVQDNFDTIYLDYLSATIAPSLVDEAGGILEWDNIEGNAPGGTFDPGEEILLSVNFMAMTATPDQTRARNTATSTAFSGEVTSPPSTDDVEIDEPPAPSIQVTKQRITPDPALVGEDVVFRVTVTNNGNMPLTDVDVTDTYDTTYLDFASASIAPDTVDEIAGQLLWNDIEGNAPGGDFDPGESIVITTSFLADLPTPPQVRANNSVVADAEDDTVTDGPAEDDVEIDPIGSPDIEIEKRNTSPDPTTIGAGVAFTIVITNTGDVALTDVDISDTFDTIPLSFDSASLAPTTIYEPGGTLTWETIEGLAPGGTFDPGETIVITTTFTTHAATAPLGQKAQNIALVAAESGTVLDGPTVAEVGITDPKVQIVKTLTSGSPAVVGEEVTYELAIENTGDTTLIDLDILDSFDTVYLDFVSASIVPGIANEPGGTLVWDAIEANAPGGDFSPGDILLVDLVFLATAATPDPDLANNNALVQTNGNNVEDGPSTAGVEINTVFFLANVDCQPTADRQIELSWVDQALGETDFQIQAAIGDSGFMTLETAPSSTADERGENYSVSLDGLLPGQEHSFRVRARNRLNGEFSDWVESARGCSTAPAAAETLGCVEGQVLLQGRSNHGALPIRIDGAPAGTTQSDGSFSVCGIPQGERVVTAGGACYLPTQAQDVSVIADSAVRLPDINLLGGDIDENNDVDLYDLVRVGWDFRSSPPTDPEADCTADDVVNIFDLVLVGSNFDLQGPLDWPVGADEDPQGEGQAQAKPNQLPFLSFNGSASSSAREFARLQERTLDDSEIELVLSVEDIRGLYGVDFSLRFDPTVLEVVDANPDLEGMQMTATGDWAQIGYTARNSIDAEAGRARFAASLRSPAQPMDGDIEIATLRLRVISEDGTVPEDAYSIEDVKLADRLGNPIEAELSFGGERTDTRSVYLPMLSAKAER